MAENLILAEQRFTTALSPNLGCYGMDVPATIELALGETYKIRFDNEDYVCSPIDVSAMIPGALALGNGAGFGLPGNGEPFIVAVYSDSEEITVLSLLDTVPTEHTISIYHVAEEDKDYLIKGSTLKGIADAIREKTGGTAKMPPVNFPDAIRSIIGEGGGEGNGIGLKIVTGTFNTSTVGTGRQTITHGLNVMPDFIMVYLSGIDPDFSSDGSIEKISLSSAWGFHSTFATKVSGNLSGYVTPGLPSFNATGFDKMSSSNQNAGYIYCPNDTTFQVGRVDSGNGVSCLAADTTYSWVAISGMGTGGSGGSSDDVRYVTFMSYDGTVEYGKIPVAVGYDCPNPKFDTPKRESTAQYKYTFAGWSTVANGGVDENALKAVSEDRTVYANFIATVIYYTISYYDGDTLLKDEHLPYGAIPSYAPTKTGYTFNGWSPEIAEVTEDASYYAQWIEKLDFATLSWAEIASYAEQGKAAEAFDLGATKQFAISGGYNNSVSGTVTARIIGFNHDDLADGSGKAGITLMLEGFYHKNLHWSTGGTADRRKKMWPDATCRNEYILPTATGTYKVFPADLLSAMKRVTKKYYDHNDNTQKTCTDTMFLPAYVEVAGTNGVLAYVNTEGEQYEYYKTFANRKITFNGAVVPYYTRTKQSATTEYVWGVDASGNSASFQQATSNYYAFCCICI